MPDSNNRLSKHAQHSTAHYCVLFDSSGMLAASWAEITHSRTLEFKKKFDLMPDIVVDLIVVRPVFEEWRKRFDDFLDKKLAAAKDVNDLLDPNAPVIRLSEADLEKRAKEYVKRLGFKIIEPDLGQFDLMDMFNRANSRNPKPPFNEKGAGFKDAVIATAMLTYIAQHIDIVHIIICSDNVMTEYLKEKIHELPSVKSTVQIVKSIEEADSSIRLNLKQLRLDLAFEAQIRFYKQDNRTGYFYDLGLQNTVEAEYLTEYPNPSVAALACRNQGPKSLVSSLTTVGGNTYLIPDQATWKPQNSSSEVLETVFSDQSGDKLIWESTISYIKTYQLEQAGLTSISPQSAGIVEHQVIYTQRWSTKVNSQDYFINPQLEGSLLKIFDTFRYYPPTSSLTATGLVNTLAGGQLLTTSPSIATSASIAASYSTFRNQSGYYNNPAIIESTPDSSINFGN